MDHKNPVSGIGDGVLLLDILLKHVLCFDCIIWQKVFMSYIEQHPEVLQSQEQPTQLEKPTAPSPVFDRLFERTPRGLEKKETINMHDIRRFFPNLLPVLLLICICEFTACTHPLRRLVFQPHKIELVPPFPKDVTHLERFWLKTEQGDVEWWLFEGDGIDTSHQGPAVLMAHGNRELIDFYLNRAEMYQRMGYTVLLGEYRGYGRSAGKPSRKRIASDYRRFYDHLISLPTVDPKRIVFHGRSLGGSVLSELSRHRPPAAVIVESTFTSIKAMAHGAPEILLSDNYDTVSALLAYEGPILIIHGTKDKVVPVKHALEMKKQIPTAELILYDCGHSDGPPVWEIYWKDITEFLDRDVSD